MDELIRHLTESNSRRYWLRGLGTAGAICALAVWLGRADFRQIATQQQAPIRAIAVIPFVNVQNKPEIQYLADGISEDVINSLARLPDLKVIARSSSFRLRADNIDVRSVGSTLGVRALLLGRLSESNGRLSVTVDLVDTADGTHIWGTHYSHRTDQLASLQSDIARDVAERIRSELTLTDRLKLFHATRINPEAYALLLRGRYEVRLYTPESRQKSVTYLEQAIALDSGFALAHAELAAGYRLLSASGIRSAAEMLPKAEAAARRALALDDKLPEAHFAMAGIKRDEWDWAAAQRAYHYAIRINPNLAAAHAGLATCLSVTGDHDAALKAARRARELDPIALPSAISVAAVYYNARRYDQTVSSLNEALGMDPSAPVPWTWIGMAHGARGQFGDALRAFQKAQQLGDRTPATRCYYAYSLARSGRRREALTIVRKLQQSSEFVPASTLAIAYAGLDQNERAIQLLESSYSSREPQLQYLNVEGHFDSLRGDKRFHNLAKRIGLSR